MHLEPSVYLDRLATFYQHNGLLVTFQRVCREFAGIIDIPWLCFSGYIPGYPNKKEIRVFALRRSGQHAIINWIKYQIRSRYCFLNDCIPDENPFDKCIRSNSRIASKLAEHNYLFWEREISGKLSKKGVLIYNYESKSLDSIITNQTDLNRIKWVGESEKKFDIIILRDPYNLFASKLNWVYKEKRTPNPESFKLIISYWKQYAKEFLGETNYLKDKVPISYNLWFCSKKYRMNIARKLDLKFTDKGMYEVAKYGPTLWGASFDGLSYDGNANLMKVLDRWKNFRNDNVYKKIILDDEMLSLSDKIFGEIPGTKELLK